MKFLNQEGVTLLWQKTKDKIANAIKENITDKLNAANGIATLDENSKLTASQLPSLKTVNGESIVGTGNISIDLSIYQIVESLPESNQNPNKIYLVLTKPATEQEQDVYTEYAWINNKWEKFGEYKADIELDDYLKISDIAEKVKDAGFVDLTSTQDITGYKTFKRNSAGDPLTVEAFVGAAMNKCNIVYRNTDKRLGSMGFNYDCEPVVELGNMSSNEATKKLLHEGNYTNYATKDEAITTDELNGILV